MYTTHEDESCTHAIHTHAIYTHTYTQTLASPMQNILCRLAAQDYIQIIFFTDDMILNSPVEEWPVCECFIAFYSKGFPLEKAIEYVKLRNPMVFNDLQEQYSLMDR